ncbi:MAG: hypothetical protein K6B72_12870 [Lachnospiraceae bacterium]|nr:hypothetical protein [Lachnospiraceae bacterium]
MKDRSEHAEARKLQLHYWYIDECESKDEKYLIGHGIVTGHREMQDSTRAHTSAVQSISIDEAEKELVLTTKNSVYHCPLAYCRFKKQDEYPDIIPDYQKLRQKYKGKLPYPSIEPGKVLLVLANFCHYYFHSVYYVPEGSEDSESLEFHGWPHVGMFQDSYLISVENAPIDLRYFPHYQHVEFYSEDTNDMPLFIENIGDVTLYASTSCGTLKLEPGERKEVKRENAEKEMPMLLGGELYPAGIFEE